ncbi:MAG TPA: hypothetical protein VGC16_04345, partial [Rhizomicrobium sp.]
MPDGTATANLYRPKLLTVLREGYGGDATIIPFSALCLVHIWYQISVSDDLLMTAKPMTFSMTILMT